jgi:hypothetical protein
VHLDAHPIPSESSAHAPCAGCGGRFISYFPFVCLSSRENGRKKDDRREGVSA